MLDRDLLRKLRRLEIVTRRRVNSQLAGQYHSAFKGLGMSFSEVRQYCPGDEVRFIDWNVSARMNELYVKQFVEERDLTAMILWDGSDSGDFGTTVRSKREYAAEVAMVLALSAITNNDRVGLIIFTDRIERFVPAKKGRKHVLRVITEILDFRPEAGRRAGTDLAAGLEFLRTVARRHTIAFLISDFIADGYEKAFKIAARKHDLVPIRVSDPMEAALPQGLPPEVEEEPGWRLLAPAALSALLLLPALLWSGTWIFGSIAAILLVWLSVLYYRKPAVKGVWLLEDAESGETVAADLASPRVAAAFQAQERKRISSVEELFKRLDIEFISLQTDTDYVAPIAKFFRARARRLAC